MKRIFAVGVLLATVMGVLSLFSGTASATPAVAPCVQGLVAGFPSHTTVKNDVDSGNHGNWAVDNFKRTTSIYNNCDGTYTVNIVDGGTFKTDPGAHSPNQGFPLPNKSVDGAFNGKATFTVWSRSGPVTQAPATISGSPDTSNWPTRFFKLGGDFGRFTMGAWEWTYTTSCDSNTKLNEKWVDAYNNGDGGQKGDGDITGKAASCAVVITTTPPPTTTTTPPATSSQPPATTGNNNSGGSGGNGGTVNQVTSVPVGAPQTGFGGAHGDSSWLLYTGIGSILAASVLLGYALFRRGTRVTS